MQNQFSKFVFNKIKKYQLKNILILNEVLDISSIKELSYYVDNIFISTNNRFTEKHYLGNFRGLSNIHVYLVKSVDDLVFLKDKVDVVINSIVSNELFNMFNMTNFFFSKTKLIGKFNLFDIDDSYLLVRKGFNSTEISNDIKQNSEEFEDNQDIEEIIPTTFQIKTIDSHNNPNFVSFYTVNYNTSKLINLLIRSIHKNIKSFKYDIWIFDNSDSEKLILDEDWNDVHIIDNSKGQIINYDVELHKYTDKSYFDKSAGFISLKHSLAIQYGFESNLISDNMILCDSDILLYRDIDFIDETKIAAGLVLQTGSLHPRLCPFLCYINKKLCRDYNIQYFDPTRIVWGLDSNKSIIKDYDTGGSFYQDIEHYNKSLINIYNYCIHLGSRSRTDKSIRRNNFNVDEICQIINLFNDKVNNLNAKDFEKYYKNSQAIAFREVNNDNLKPEYYTIQNKFQIINPSKKYVIYTCITGNYDKLREDFIFDSKNFDYYCFTNSKNITSKRWNIIDISEVQTLLNLQDDNVRLARFIKTHPHLFFKQYEKSIWIDGNVLVICNKLVENFISLLPSDQYLLVSEHPKLHSIYEEAELCKKLKKDDDDIIDKEIQFIQDEKFESNNNHVQTNIILRNHNDEHCKFLMEKWWEMILNYSRRDQLSFNYVFWKYNGKYITIPYYLFSINFFSTNFTKHLNTQPSQQLQKPKRVTKRTNLSSNKIK